MAAQVSMTVAEFKAFGEATQGRTRADVAGLLDVGAAEKSSGRSLARDSRQSPPQPFAVARAAFGMSGRALHAAFNVKGGRGIGAYRYTAYGAAVAQRHATRVGLALAGALVCFGAGCALLAIEASLRAIPWIVRAMRGA